MEETSWAVIRRCFRYYFRTAIPQKKDRDDEIQRDREREGGGKGREREREGGRGGEKMFIMLSALTNCGTGATYLLFTT